MCSVCMIQPAFVNTEITEIISFKEDFQMKVSERIAKLRALMAEKGIDELFLATHRLVEEGIKCELDVLGGYEEDLSLIHI